MVLARAAVIALLVLSSIRTTAADEATIHLLKVWIAAVHAHVPGTSDQAAASIAVWDRWDLIRLRPFVHALVGSVPDARTVRVTRIQLSNADAVEVRALATTALGSLSANDFIKRAALLHSDLVLRAGSIRTLVDVLPSQRLQPPGGVSGASLETPLVIARGPDGRFEGTELGNLNWDSARDLLDAVTPLPAPDATVRLWYRSVGAWFASAYSFGEAWPHFQRAGKLLPDDPGVLFGEAAVHETLASPPIQDYVRVTRLPGQQRFLWVTSARRHLERAEQLLTRALRFEPRFVEAQLRLGRVIDQLGRHDAALVQFTAVLEARPDRALAFYAHVFRGDAERALQQYDAARRSYQQALDLFPRAQSARIALSYLARQRSDQEAALAVLLPTLSASPVGRQDDDPWWDYHRGDGRHADELLQQLRAPFLADRQP
jgi:hypothetical protein